MAFAIVEFFKKRDIAIVPFCWLNEEETICFGLKTSNVSNLVQSKKKQTICGKYLKWESWENQVWFEVRLLCMLIVRFPVDRQSTAALFSIRDVNPSAVQCFVMCFLWPWSVIENVYTGFSFTLSHSLLMLLCLHFNWWYVICDRAFRHDPAGEEAKLRSKILIYWPKMEL